MPPLAQALAKETMHCCHTLTAAAWLVLSLSLSWQLTWMAASLPRMMVDRPAELKGDCRVAPGCAATIFFPRRLVGVPTPSPNSASWAVWAW